MSIPALRLTLLAALVVVTSGCGPTTEAPTCLDGEKNGTETDVDCGGSCGRCFDGRACAAPADCMSGLCTLGRCGSILSGGGGGSTGGGGGRTGGGGGATGGGGGGSVGGGGGSVGGGGGSVGGGGGSVGGGGGSVGGGGGSVGGGGGSLGGGGGSLGGGGGSLGGGGGSVGGGGGSVGGGGGSSAGVLLISQVQTRGDSGGNDEFIELFNPGTTPVTFDATWSVAFRSAAGTCTSNVESERTVGAGQIVPARGYLLLTNSGYNGTVAGDGTYALGLVDAGSLVLRHNGAVIDALCFQFDSLTETALTTCSLAYTCEGAPPLNPHNNTTASTSNQDTSLRRGAVDTQNNAADFATTTVSTPRNRFSPTTP